MDAQEFLKPRIERQESTAIMQRYFLPMYSVTGYADHLTKF